MTMGASLAAAAAGNPKKTAFICEGRELTYGEADKAANRFANALIDRGVGRGDRVAVIAHNSLEYAVTYFGIARAGGVSLHLSACLAPDAIAHCLGRGDAVAALCDPELADAVSSTGRRLAVVSTGRGCVSWSRRSRGSGTRAAAGRAVFGSLYQWHDGVSEGRAPYCPVAPELGRDRRGLVRSRIRRSDGGCGADESCGRRLHMVSTWRMRGGDPGSPPEVGRAFLPCGRGTLSDNGDISRSDPDSASSGSRGVRAGPAVGSPQDGLWRRAAAARPDQTGGGTAAAVRVHTKLRHDRDRSIGNAVQGRPGQASRCARSPKIECAVYAASGSEAEPGEVGELCFRGETLMQGYVGGPEQTQVFFRGGDGWAWTGDLAIRDEKGC